MIKIKTAMIPLMPYCQRNQHETLEAKGCYIPRFLNICKGLLVASKRILLLVCMRQVFIRRGSGLFKTLYQVPESGRLSSYDDHGALFLEMKDSLLAKVI